MTWIRPADCEAGSCIEYEYDKAYAKVRDTEGGTTLYVPRASWDAFLAAVRAQGYADAVAKVRQMPNGLFLPSQVANILESIKENS
ncbi:MAG: DUF397 domain-containing protein [Chloroflexota bacterium]